MASSFDRWEKDPFFSAAEEVQESADRMESTYRTWIHAKRDASCMWEAEELKRDLHTTLGTTKWQLEVFERAVKSSYHKSVNNDAKDRHREFIVAIEDLISKVENSLRDASSSGRKKALPWVRLDEGECNELALFLSGQPPASGDNTATKSFPRENSDQQEMGKGPDTDCSKDLGYLGEEGGSVGVKEEKSHGHRRTASASADIGAWKISISEDAQELNSLDGQTPPPRPPRKVPSLSGILGSVESASTFWPKNGIRKWKAMDRQQESDAAPLRSSQFTRGINACYEKSKSCLDSYDECYDKQLYGWYGAIQRQLQRSQYQMQYSRPVQAALSIVFILFLIVLVALRAL